MDNFFPDDVDYHISEERWQIIDQYKKNILQNNDIRELHDSPQIKPEVIASWIRSRNMKIDPYNPPDVTISHREYQRILEENRMLIEVTKPLIDIFNGTALSSDYKLELIDKQGISFIQEGSLNLQQFEGEKVFREETMGTNAHTLSMILKRPVQLVGPEHYCVGLHDIVASAAPILDDAGEAIACLVLTQPLTSEPWEDNFQKLLLHTLALITAMASAVEAQIKLKKSNESLQFINECLRMAYDTVEATLASVDEGIIAVDFQGYIVRVNREAARLLRFKPEELGKKRIQDYLESQSRLMAIAARGENANTEETICIGNDEQPYIINIRPIMNPQNNQLDIAVLRLNHAEKANAIVSNRSGAATHYRFESIIGQSKPLVNAIEQAKRFANSPENVLLIGESGTGKELFAQAIHNQHRPQGPFMAINCAAMPRELIESELFGYEGGSFTGAERSGRPGKIELAHGGTLFLDEIGDMPLELQAVLLRVLEDKQVMRIGGRRYKQVDFRVIAATNKDLHEMAAERLFREDLYYRLSVLTIRIPPLRLRDNDTQILSEYFIENYCHKLGWKVPRISADAMKIINEYDWPGNVRQLENAMRYAVNTSQNGIINTKDLPDHIVLSSSPVRLYGVPNETGKVEEVLSLKKMEKAAIDLALQHAENSIPKAAALLEISKATLYRKLKEYNEEIEE